ncbi:MAG: branched-chain amino acid ABC transporter substrate-binding protein [Deltaproteobacteria bacterium]|jgi:branched-chain amino acid transport system substrate-binding protein|nr:branched-chain amino acid ABC transporter substrate-binding protein [Deltaproteobacteria bacterium]
MRQFFVTLALACCFALGAGIASAQEPLRIGFGGALLGDLASYGLSNLYGVEYAIDEVNASGGVLGQQVVLVQEDDSCEADLAAQAAAKLISAGLKLVLGHSCSGATIRALSVYGNNALVISSSSTDNNLTDDGLRPYFFRTTPRDDAQSALQYGLIKQKGFKKIAILHDAGDHGSAMAILAETAIKEDPDYGAELVLIESLTAGEISFDELIAKIKGAAADAIVWGGYYNDAAKLAIGLKEQGVTAPLIGADGLFNERFISLGEPAVEGSFVTGQNDFSLSEAGQKAIANHKTRHAEDIGPYFFYSAGAAQALFAAVEKAGSATDLDLIKKHLQEDTVETVMGPIRFDAKGDIIGAGFKLYEVKGGKFVEVRLDAAP